VLRSGQARCWGSGSAGQLGIGFVNQRHRPVRVKGPGGTGLLTDVAALTAGGERTCARLRSGQARCWGDDDLGGLGNGLLGEVAYPGTVLDVAGTGPLTGVRSISAGDSHTCAVVGPGGALRCWGKGTTGQRGDDSTEPGAQLPVVVVRS
jgi:alpha-tubulin suppressor-like RCC1 family protein